MFHRFFLCLFLGHFVEFYRGKHNVFLNSHVWKQIKLLEHHSDFFPYMVNIHRLTVISVPSNRTCPLVGISNRFKDRRNVDFPQPEGPINARTSPFLMVVEIPFNTS